MFSRRKLLPALLALLVVFLSACGGGKKSTNKPPPPPSNIDLAITDADFTVNPSAADAEDTLTLSGTIKNLGTETANPDPGDRFLVRFNLSKDGTFEVNEQGFLLTTVTDPIPPGGSYQFTYPNASFPNVQFGTGDTFSNYGIFCDQPAPAPCSPPQTGVVGVKVDAANDINELNEANNYAFKTIQVVGTQVGASLPGCDTGNCELNLTDGLSTVRLQVPCTANCGNVVVFPNEIHRTISGFLKINNCTNDQSPGGQCGAGWTLTGVTNNPLKTPSTLQLQIVCTAFFGDGLTKSCPFSFDIRDPNY